MAAFSPILRSLAANSIRPLWGLGKLLGLGLGALLLFPFIQIQGAEVAWHEGFDAPETTWSLLRSGEGRLIAQSRERQVSGPQVSTYESLIIEGRVGYSIPIKHTVPKAPLLDELQFEVTVRSTRPGIQLAVEIACPRSASEQNTAPPRLTVVGSRYTQRGTWQTLRLEEVRQAAKRQARLEKSPSGRPYDLQEAYIDRVVVLVPGGLPPATVDLDDLIVRGVVFGPPREEAIRRTAHNSPGPLLEGPMMESVIAPAPSTAVTPVEITRQGDALAVEGKAFLPRMVQHRGEPLTMLADLGFNAVWLDQVPTDEQRAEAHKARVWLVCPPPANRELSQLAAESNWQTVLAWSLGPNRRAIDVDAIRSQVEGIRLHDRSLQRPLVVEALDRRRTYGQLCDILVDPVRIRYPSGQRLANEMQERLLGCVPWIVLETGLSPRARRQTEAFSPRQTELAYHPPLLVREVALEAVATGSRGIAMRTSESLASSQPAIRNLVTQLELLNRELSLLEPWFVGGKQVTGGGMDRRADVPFRCWQLERARLVLIPPHAPHSSITESITVAGVPETASAHLVTIAGLIPLEARRVAGGLRVTAADLTGGGMILLTDDSRAIAQLREHTVTHAERSAKAERDLAVNELSLLDSDPQGTSRGDHLRDDVLAACKVLLQQCDLMLAARDHPQAFQVARTVRYRLLRHVQETVKKSVPTSFAYESWPLPESLAAWSSYQALRQATDSLARGTNILAGGDFERLDAVQASGWSHHNYDSVAWQTKVELAADMPRHGVSALRLTAAPVPGQLSDVAKGQPLVWVTSPTVSLPPGSIVEISGWARVVSDAAGGRLLIVDTLAGEEWALRMGPSPAWQSFRAIRAVDASGNFSIQFALDGVGRADVDAVMIRQVLSPGRRDAAAAPSHIGK